jgi:hypothetical protein
MRYKSLPFLRLQQRVQKTLEENSFTIINSHKTKNNFRFISNFGQELEQSTFYVDKQSGSNGLVIGAHITLDNRVLTKSLTNKIQLTSAKYNVSCSPIKHNSKDDTGTMSLQMLYSFLKYNEKNFLLYINSFKDCIKTLYADIQKYLQYQDAPYLDLSMFEGADWSIFDPYTYIMERDKHYNGSWERYVEKLKKGLNKKEKLAELIYVEMCKRFEDQNNVPIDIACDYIIDQIMEHSTENKNEKVFN